MIKKLLCVGVAALLSAGAIASEPSATGVAADDNLLIADNRRQERRGGRQDRRDDKRECKQDSRGEGDDKAEADGGDADA